MVLQVVDRVYLFTDAGTPSHGTAGCGSSVPVHRRRNTESWYCRLWIIQCTCSQTQEHRVMVLQVVDRVYLFTDAGTPSHGTAGCGSSVPVHRRRNTELWYCRLWIECTCSQTQEHRVMVLQVVDRVYLFTDAGTPSYGTAGCGSSVPVHRRRNTESWYCRLWIECTCSQTQEHRVMVLQVVDRVYLFTDAGTPSHGTAGCGSSVPVHRRRNTGSWYCRLWIECTCSQTQEHRVMVLQVVDRVYLFTDAGTPSYGTAGCGSSVPVHRRRNTESWYCRLWIECTCSQTQEHRVMVLQVVDRVYLFTDAGTPSHGTAGCGSSVPVHRRRNTESWYCRLWIECTCSQTQEHRVMVLQVVDRVYLFTDAGTPSHGTAGCGSSVPVHRRRNTESWYCRLWIECTCSQTQEHRVMVLQVVDRVYLFTDAGTPSHGTSGCGSSVPVVPAVR